VELTRKYILETTRAGNQRLYDNDYFKIKTVIDDDQQFGIDINRCLMFEILEKNGHPELGPVLCKYDYILAENVSKWVSFERKETIADGHSRCDFRYFKKELTFSDKTLFKQAVLIFKYLEDQARPVDKLDLKELGLSEQEIEDWIKTISFIQSHPELEKDSDLTDRTFIGFEHQREFKQQWKILMDRKTPLVERIKILHSISDNLKREDVLSLAGLAEDHGESQDLRWNIVRLLQKYYTRFPEIPQIIEKLLFDRRQAFSIREMCLLTYLRQKGAKSITKLCEIAENTSDDPFIRGRVMDAVAGFTNRLPNVIDSNDDFYNLPIPVQRSVIDFIGKYRLKFDLIMEIAARSKVHAIKKVCFRILGEIANERAIKLLSDVVRDINEDQLLRQAAIEALGVQEVDENVLEPILAVLLSPDETTFLKLEALQTVKDWLSATNKPFERNSFSGSKNTSPDSEILKIRNVEHSFQLMSERELILPVFLA